MGYVWIIYHLQLYQSYHRACFVETPYDTLDEGF